MSPITIHNWTEYPPRALHLMTHVAHATLLGMLCLFAVASWWNIAPYDAAWQLVAAQFLSGRAGSAHLGMELGFNRYYLLFQIFLHDFLLMLYLFPLFVRYYDRLAHLRIIGRPLDRLHALAMSHRERIAPFGIVGLMLFVFFPFWNVGPLVGMMAAYVLGLRMRVAFAAVLVGDLGAVATWIWAYDKIQGYNKTLALIGLIALFIAAMAAPYCIQRWRYGRMAALPPNSVAPPTSPPPQDPASPQS
ncbi:MAG TPA: hypothetical protein ENN65_05075 [Candidatus Hydrogenedentes bacterium]|nr:hypothetical protein [Candidatus Hydrogenedentota bacterium]